MTVTGRLGRTRGGAVGATLFLTWLVLAVPVAAHSELVSSTPAAGSSVASAPDFSVVLSFTEALKAGSKADIVGSSGSTAGTARIDPTDNTKLTWTTAAPLPPDTYSIRWTSIATDGDILRGTIPFTVTAAVTSAPSTAASASAAAPSASPSPAPSPASGDASSTSAGAILPVLAALAVIAVLAVALVRRRRPA